MGDVRNEGLGDERPAHEVYVSALYMWETKVTVGQFRDVYEWSLQNGYGLYDMVGNQARIRPLAISFSSKSKLNINSLEEE